MGVGGGFPGGGGGWCVGGGGGPGGGGPRDAKSLEEAACRAWSRPRRVLTNTHTCQYTHANTHMPTHTATLSARHTRYAYLVHAVDVVPGLVHAKAALHVTVPQVGSQAFLHARDTTPHTQHKRSSKYTFPLWKRRPQTGGHSAGYRCLQPVTQPMRPKGSPAPRRFPTQTAPHAPPCKRPRCVPCLHYRVRLRVCAGRASMTVSLA